MVPNEKHNGVGRRHVLPESSSSSSTNVPSETEMETNNNNHNISEHQQTSSLSSSSSSTTTLPEKTRPYRMEIVWRNVFLMSILHLSAAYGVYLYWFHAKYSTLLFLHASVFVLGLGITCGAHRLWAHRCYEASLLLRVVLMILNSASLQNDIWEWSRDHRVHHKFSETDADPHNSNRGFFFAHVGWLLCRKHPDVRLKGRTVSMVDLEQDPVVRFQRKFYKPMTVLLTFVVPTLITYYCFGEDLYSSFFLTLARYTFSLHATWLVNSAAHLWGKRPYDTSINPVESPLVEMLSLGEGYHNYHHVFPYDYSASEMSWTHTLNFTTWFIDCCAWLGLAWNLKKVDPHTVMQRVKRTGDLEMVQIHHQQTYYSQWRHTVLPVIFLIIAPIFGVYMSRRVMSWLYLQYSGIPDKWP